MILSKIKWILRMTKDKKDKRWPEDVRKTAGTWKDFTTVEDIRKSIGTNTERESL